MNGQVQTDSGSDYRQAMNVVMREFVDIINREASEEELYVWRRSLKERYPDYYRDLLMSVREQLDQNTQYAS